MTNRDKESCSRQSCDCAEHREEEKRLEVYSSFYKNSLKDNILYNKPGDKDKVSQHKKQNELMLIISKKKFIATFAVMEINAMNSTHPDT